MQIAAPRQIYKGPMSLLAHDDILHAIDQGEIVFTPALQPEQIREVSVDLTLGSVFRKYIDIHHPIPLIETTDYHEVTEEVITDRYVLYPQQTVLGITREKVHLPHNMCGWLEGRSRFARMGLLIHISAGLVQPGVANAQVLEITNLSPNPLELRAGQRICQLAFQRLDSQAEYMGKYKTQEKP